MTAYEIVLTALLGVGVGLVPVVWLQWNQPVPIDGCRADIKRVMPAYAPLDDSEGSIGITVAKWTGKRVTRPLKVVYVYAARHASNAWRRPSAYVRHHARTGKLYHDTISACMTGRDWIEDKVKTYKPRHLKMGVA